MIPEQLVGTERFIQLEPESKAPRFSPEGPFFAADDDELQEWIENGGNVGLNLGELVALDVDSDTFGRIANKYLPQTFSVRSGSGGEHRYYRSDWSGRSQFSEEGTDLGSIRSGNWYVVVPPSIHPNGEPYRALRDRPIRGVPVAQLQDFIDEVSDRFGTASTGGGGAGGAGGSSIPSIPSEYPNRPAEWPTLRKWVSANGFLSWFDKTTSKDWSGLEWTLAKCLSEGGFSEASISDALDRLHHNSKWHNRGPDYRNRTVRKAIVAACEDEYVDFSSPGDMGPDGSESRKTEESGSGRTLSGGENSMEYNTIENLTVYNADSVEEAEDGDRVIRVELTNMSGRGDDGEPVDTDFVSITKGTLRENGDFGVAPEFPGQSKSVGSADPDDLRLIASGLEEVADSIEN